ncbi:MAG TPA: hypothetical protein VM370_05225 [Candidatus Thermoplasmatota archaeon]|nr:hypothetical protein [Candidatus Thermoplasmatota archaeon]
MRLLALSMVLLMAGCSSPSGMPFARDPLPAEPYYKEYRELVAGEHHKDFEIPVDRDARALSVNVTLQSNDHGLPLPGAVPAQLKVAILAPDGSVLDEAALDPRTASAQLAAAGLAPGRYLARVDGFGASEPIDGKEYGAAYVLVVEVQY